MKIRAKRRVSYEHIAYGIAHMEGLTKAQSVRIVKLLVQHMVLHLAEGAVIDLPGAFKLEALYTQPRPGSHPKTHDPIEVKEGVRLRSQLSTKAKELLLEQIDVFREKHNERRDATINRTKSEEE